MFRVLFGLVFLFQLNIFARAILTEDIKNYDTSVLWQGYAQTWHLIAVNSHQKFFDLTHVNSDTPYTAFSEEVKISDAPTWIHSLQSLPYVIDGHSRTGDLTVTMMLDLQFVTQRPIQEDIRLVETSKSQTDWVKVAAASTNNSEYGVNTLFKDIFKEKPNDFEFLIAYKNTKPIASTVIFYEGSYASLYWVGVIPTERSKGFGKAILLRALDRIRRRGIRFVILQAQPMGVPLYSKLGFISLGELARY
jgi:ribosomal protein S18 acetylase RimI-like enzyme